MLWRISAALVALSIVHGSENVARDGARLATEIRQEAPQAVVASCLDKPDACRQLLGQVSGHIGGYAAVPASPHLAQPAHQPQAGVKPPPVPVASGEFPLPPVRPASVLLRKGA